MKINKKGLGAFELLLASFIVLLTVVVTMESFVFINNNGHVLMSYFASYLKGREALDQISKDCRMGIRVMDNYAGHTTSDNCLVLKIPSIDSSGNVIDVNDKFDYVAYWVSGGNLWRQVIPGIGSSRPASNSIFKNAVESILFASEGVLMSSVAHKTAITRVTAWVSISETFLGRDYRITPGTTIKLMNYEWRFVR